MYASVDMITVQEPLSTGFITISLFDTFIFLFLPCLFRWKSISHDADFEMAWVVVCHVEMLGDGQSRCSECDRSEVLRCPVGQASLGFSYVYLPALLAMDGIYAIAGSARKLLV